VAYYWCRFISYCFDCICDQAKNLHNNIKSREGATPQDDFGSSLQDFIEKYLASDQLKKLGPPKLLIEFKKYDWSLNAMAK
jgi:hypothetical protein